MANRKEGKEKQTARLFARSPITTLPSVEVPVPARMCKSTPVAPPSSGRRTTKVCCDESPSTIRAEGPKDRGRSLRRDRVPATCGPGEERRRVNG